MQITTRFIFIIALFCLTAPACVLADLRQFIPQIYSTEGDLEINASYESKENRLAGKGTQTSDTFLNEKIVLTVNGFVYHPRFLLFLGKIGLGFSQEKYSSSSAGTDESSESNMFIQEYEFRTLLLPEHPYNLELYAMRYNPFIVGKANPEISSVTLSEGALFNYKKRPFKFKLNYSMSDTESSRSVSESKNFNAFANYFKENFTLAGALSRAVTKNTIGSVGSEFKLLNYSIENQIRLFQRKVYFTSNASQVISDQQSVKTVTEGNRLTWTEQLNMYLPWNFNTILTYGYFKDVQKSRDIDTEAKGLLDSMSNSAGLSITHMLYESLRTVYNFNYNATFTSTGDSEITMNYFGTSYIKKIPWGKLIADLQLSNSHLERIGAPTVIDENIQAKIFDEFTLKESNIDVELIRVFVIDPVTGGPIELTNNVHYSVDRVGDTVKIFIIDIPFEAKNPDPFYEYTFKVRYSFIVSSIEIEKSGFGYNLKLELFDRLVNPYYLYNHEDQKLLSGTLSGGTDTITSQTVGLVLQKQPYSLLMEYQDYDSRLTPSKRFRAETKYMQNFEQTTYIDARVYYTKVQNLAGLFDPESTTETSIGMDLRVSKRYPRKNLTVTAFGAYSNRKSNFKTNVYSLGGAVTWKVAMIDLSLGANMSMIESALDTGKAETTSQTYYFTLKRKLF
jgi:hypothetical protein